MVKKRKNKKQKVKKVVEKPFGDGTLTNSAFFGMIRSALRQKSRFFITIKNCRERARIPYNGSNKRKKWLYKCEECGNLFDAKDTVVHHKIECGGLTSFEDLAGFTQRLFCDSENLALICNECHIKIHNKE